MTTSGSDEKTLYDIQVTYEKSCLKSLQKLAPDVSANFFDMTLKIMADSKTNGLHVEPIQGAEDASMRSVRMDRGMRAIGSLQGSTMVFLHVNTHDKAYRWAKGRRVSLDPKTRRIRVIEAVLEREPASDSQPGTVQPMAQAGLFDQLKDDELRGLGLGDGEIARARRIVNEADLDALNGEIDETSHEILTALAMGFEPSDIPALISGDPETPMPETVEDFVHSDEGRATIFVPESEAELRRVLEGDLAGWRTFLHPEQRRLAYRDYNGPALVRGGAGTGKTVVAMHRAKYLADQIADDPARSDERVLFTTFTVNLARDIEANLKTLCPEHVAGPKPRIEVKNLDAWVGEYLRRRNFDRKIVYYIGDRDVREIWQDVIEGADIPEGLTPEFLRNEWTQVVQAQGVETKGAYFKASRAGRGTPLDRKKRARIWPIFEAFRARMRDEGLAEPDDAYREAIAMLDQSGNTLPYAAVVLDEAQDMGEQAFRLVAAIASGVSGARNSLFMVGDAHQRIYDRKASLSACGINVRGRSRRLRLNYRTSDEIRRWAVSVLEGMAVDDLDEDADSLRGYRSSFLGPDPELVAADTPEGEVFGIVEAVRALPDGTSVCVLARSNARVDAIAAGLEAAGLAAVRLRDGRSDDPDIAGVRVATMHRSKGLEFDAVFLASVNAIMVPPVSAMKAAVDQAGKREAMERERSLVHVAATRAKTILRVSWSGEPSEILPVPLAKVNSPT
jgi:superfamily I DNA/RNA helicase